MKNMDQQTVGIFGTSSMARETGDVAYALGYTPIYIAKNEAEACLLKQSESVLLESDTGKLSELGCVIGIGDNLIREKIFNRFHQSVSFINLIHPSATVGFGQSRLIDDARGLVMCAGARLTNNIRLGNCCIVNQNVSVSPDCSFGNFVHIAPGANISANVTIGDRCWIGAGSVVNQGLIDKKMIIESDVMVGSGAVVIGNCESNAVYAGVPAKRIK